ncbi:hypothetical protein [Streptomyces phaeochromogenes]|uniref:hypothetical protein n=1 Tax=Streptomyces phaeochromogenes TaxID=1923 RepID=UPI00386E76CD|nr:hypothetical protein OG277_52440 [Streptomyces phaeochromogenes]
MSVLDFLLTGLYPAITWMAFVVTGMVLDRLDPTSGAVQRRLAAVGPALMGFGYGISSLVLRSGGARRVMAGMPGMTDPGAINDAGLETAAFDMPVGGDLWGPDTWGLLAATPHTGSTLDLIGGIGTANTVLVCVTVRWTDCRGCGGWQLRSSPSARCPGPST